MRCPLCGHEDALESQRTALPLSASQPLIPQAEVKCLEGKSALSPASQGAVNTQAELSVVETRHTGKPLDKSGALLPQLEIAAKEDGR